MGPVLDADDALVYEHAEAVEGAAAVGLGVAEEAGLGGVEDDVGDDLMGLEGGGVEVEGGGFVVEADGGGVDDDVGVRGDGVVGGPGEVVGLGGGVGVDEVGKFGAACGVAIDDEEGGGVGEGEFDGDGAGGAACAEEDDGFAGGVDEGLQGGEEAFAVGVFADELVASADDAVDGAHEGGGLAEAVEEGDDGDFVGDGEVEAAEAEGAGAEDGGGEVGGGDFHVDVAPVEVVVGEGGFDHGDGGVSGGALGHGADEVGAEGGHFDCGFGIADWGLRIGGGERAEVGFDRIDRIFWINRRGDGVWGSLFAAWGGRWWIEGAGVGRFLGLTFLCALCF